MEKRTGHGTVGNLCGQKGWKGKKDNSNIPVMTKGLPAVEKLFF